MLSYEEGNFKILLLLCLSEMTYNISVKPLKISVQMFNGNLVTAIFAYQLWNFWFKLGLALSFEFGTIIFGTYERFSKTYSLEDLLKS